MAGTMFKQFVINGTAPNCLVRTTIPYSNAILQYLDVTDAKMVRTKFSDQQPNELLSQAILLLFNNLVWLALPAPRTNALNIKLWRPTGGILA